ncbi:MAG: hypothetical protein ACSHX6_16080 [Akkermansiaceae bacterium]
MKKTITAILLVATAAIFSSCTPAPVHVQDISIVKVPPKKVTKPKVTPKPKKVYVAPKDNPEDFRAISH